MEIHLWTQFIFCCKAALRDESVIIYLKSVHINNNVMFITLKQCQISCKHFYKRWQCSYSVQMSSLVISPVLILQEAIQLLSSSTEDDSSIIQLNSFQVLFSSDSVSAVKSISLINIKCLLNHTEILALTHKNTETSSLLKKNFFLLNIFKSSRFEKSWRWVNFNDLGKSIPVS